MSGGPWVRQIELGPMQNFIYLVGDPLSREVAVVDPAWDVEAILAAARAEGKEVVAALLTHHHHDHINGLQPLAERVPGLVAWAQRAEIDFSPELQGFGSRIRPVDPGQEILVGGATIRCLHTPGHTPGAQCFHCSGSLFSGDTLFIRGCGRCDLPGGDPEVMYDSLTRVLGALPDETRLYPGHDYGPTPVSTLGDERRSNPYLLHEDRASFVAHRMQPRKS